MVSLISRLKRRPVEQAIEPTRSVTQATESSGQKDPEKVGSTVTDIEKPKEPATASGSNLSENEADDTAEDLPDDVRELPMIVRNIVSLEDDPSALTLTFRYFLLCFVFVPPGAILFQMGSYRTTSAVYPVLFVQIGALTSFSSVKKRIADSRQASHYVGQWLASILPKKTVRIPFTSSSFSLNPGPWSVKGLQLYTCPAS